MRSQSVFAIVAIFLGTLSVGSSADTPKPTGHCKSGTHQVCSPDRNHCICAPDQKGAMGVCQSGSAAEKAKCLQQHNVTSPGQRRN